MSEQGLGGGLDGFESPYLGHTGSWDGKGGGFWGSSKLVDLEKEREMGLRWTFMPVYWRALESDGPVDLSRNIPPEWQALDRFVIAAQRRGLNILMQAPVVGGNAGGPPKWAGRREKGKSAPANMDALVAFAEKLAVRYRPGGVLSKQKGWGERYGVRAWELDNEPESYLTHWKGQAGDYAEFATLVSARIKAVDPKAVILMPGLAAGKHGLAWVQAALTGSSMNGSSAFAEQGKAYSIGPVADVVSFHNYEGLDSAFSGEPRTVAQVFGDIRAVFESCENQTPGFSYVRKKEYWHTEGNFDFLGILSSERRAAWRFQFFTRAFALGIRKVAVMDASAAERVAVRTYVRVLPDPFPMMSATREIGVLRGRAVAFRHPDRAGSGQVWVIWAVVNTGSAMVEVPVCHQEVEAISVNGQSTPLLAENGRVHVELTGDTKMPPPVLVIDRSGSDAGEFTDTPPTPPQQARAAGLGE
jgi:hypothetical protein